MVIFVWKLTLIMVAKYSPLMWFSVFRYRSRSSLAPTGLYLALNLSKRWKVCLPYKERERKLRKRLANMIHNQRDSFPKSSLSQSMNKEIIQSTQCLFLVSVMYSVHVQGVHGEVVRVQVKGLKKLLHCYFFPLKLVHDAVGIHAVGLLDEAQQMLLVHAGRGVDVCVHLEGQ